MGEMHTVEEERSRMTVGGSGSPPAYGTLQLKYFLEGVVAVLLHSKPKNKPKYVKIWKPLCYFI